MVNIPPKFWNIIIPVATLLAGYFGYEPVQEMREPSAGVDSTISAEFNIEQPAVPQAIKPAPVATTNLVPINNKLVALEKRIKRLEDIEAELERWR